ncbi:MAG: 4Fe-4S dicluster domain-containing protein [Deltaproteobacteria bacterium]|nr:4Fe-4S dicluster domain-containing protein [Deltaproteobacteria bacterium]
METKRRDFLKQTGWTLLGSGLYISIMPLLPSDAAASSTGTDNLYAYLVDTEKCIGCGKCAAACRTENSVPSECYRTWIERYSMTADGKTTVDSPHGGEMGFEPLKTNKTVDKAFFVPKLCNHCKNPNCVQVCPVGATYVTKEGFVLVDEKHCIGCSYCAQACPYGARFINPVTHTADKCTWCYHRAQKGLMPACVTVCPAGARAFGKIDDPGSTVHKVLKQKRLMVLKPETGNEPMVFYVGLDKEVR